MSLQAYQQAATRAESPRETEYRLFAQVTLALMDAAKADPSDVSARLDALDWNRRVWTVMGEDCANPANALPEATRAQIISLSLFVHRTTSQVMRREAELEVLVDLNRTMMQGLSSRPEAA